MVKISLYILIAVIIIGYSLNYFTSTLYKDTSWVPEEVFMKTDDIVKNHKYPVESHYVTTDDGYILSLFRIPFSVKKENGNNERIPVLMIHGMYGSSAQFVINGPEYALPYYLADRGFDVWLGNLRGNYYSRNHTSMCPESEDFWRFSWHEMGLYDLPAMINYISEKTGHWKIHYIGHSQGTTVFFVMASEKPEMNNRILSMQALAPVVFFGNNKCPVFKYPRDYFHIIDKIAGYFGIVEVFPKNERNSILYSYLCNMSIFFPLCKYIFFVLTGPPTEFFDHSMLVNYIYHLPAGASRKQYIHFLQLTSSGKFRKYDYGKEENLKIYNSEEPEDYELHKITTPIALHFSENDWFTDSTDVEKLHISLKNPIGLYEVSVDDFHHMDFLMGKRIHDIVYEQILKTMLEYSK